MEAARRVYNEEDKGRVREDRKEKSKKRGRVREEVTLFL